MTVLPQVIELVERFTRNLDAYKRPEYKEAHVRAEFIDPFFEALGWDVRNVQGHAEQYKDVVHEDALKTSGGTRAPDYCFRVGGVRKFFLEAKKPSVSVRGDVGPAYQLRRYTWSAKLPLGILTDFEEFAVYDCRQRPVPSEGANVGRVMYLTFDQYPTRFSRQEMVTQTERVPAISHVDGRALGVSLFRWMGWGRWMALATHSWPPLIPLISVITGPKSALSSTLTLMSPLGCRP